MKLFFTISDETAEALQMQSSFHHAVILYYEGIQYKIRHNPIACMEFNLYFQMAPSIATAV